MRKLQFWVSASLLVAAMATFTIFIGCEDEPALPNADGFENETRTDGEIPLLVTPTIDSVAVIGQHISFRAKGAVSPVTWSVGSTARGTISTMGLRTDYALYESIAVADNTIVAIDAAGRSATAIIKVGADPLQIIPTDITLVRPPAGPAASFVVQGGVPPYSSWTVLFPELGVVSQGGTYHVMNPTLIGTNIVTISDAAGDIASATVSHVLDLDTLVIIPSSTSLDINNERAIFIGAGGLPPYTWRVVYPSRGHIVSGASGLIMEYERDDEGDQIIVLEDSQGDSTQAQITQAAPTPPVITPNTVTLATTETSFAFSVSGGTPPYSWLVLTGSGTVNPNTGTSVVYTRGPNPPDGPNNYIIRVTDSASQSALATITQE